MKCKYCGKGLVEGAKFCVYCGKPVEGETEIAKPIPVEEPKEEIIPEPTEVNIAPENDIKIDEAPIESNIEVNVEPTPIELPKEEPEPIVEPAPVQPEVAPQPTIENKTEVVVKKNNPILLLIIILLLIGILGAGGFYVYKNYIEKNNKETNNNTTIEEETTAQQIPEITKDDAKKLIDLYYFVGSRPEENLFTVSIDDRAKKTIALKNVESEMKTIDCGQINGFTKTENGCVKNSDNKDKLYTNGKAIDYDALNNEYKYLFGKENELSKESFKHLNNVEIWEYLIDKNLYLKTYPITGLEGGPYYTTYIVKDFTQNDDSLIIDVGYVFMKAKDVNNSVVLATTIGNQEVTYTEEETKEGSFEADFLVKYMNLIDAYTFTFKYEDDHYVFVDMKKA